MSLVIPAAVLLPVKSQIKSPLISTAISQGRVSLRNGEDDPDAEVSLNIAAFDLDALVELRGFCDSAGNMKAVRVLDAVLKAKGGAIDSKVPSFGAFLPMLQAYLHHDRIDGWIYAEAADGCLYPELILSATFNDNKGYKNKPDPHVVITTLAFGLDADARSRSEGARTRAHTFRPDDALHKPVAEILAASGLFKESRARKYKYQKSMERFDAEVRLKFAEQFRVTGRCFAFDNGSYRRRGEMLDNRRVIHDQEARELPQSQRFMESSLFDAEDFLGQVPVHPLVKVFDLKSHEFMWVHSDYMTPYQYNASLKDKLILPPEMHDLLSILTTNLGVFVDDFIEGKSAGNVVLIKGPPGVGKTLTAEVYAEVIKRPLFAVHTGTLGTSAEDIHRNLKETFARIERWNCVGLIDEADVYVRSRGEDLEQNAIVAEFLRSAEYFRGLLFMTTNRVNDIDDAFLSRVAACISYSEPGPELAAKVWRTMAEQFEHPLDDATVAGLIDAFPMLRPRDAKMLFRLALRVANAHNEPLTVDVFRRCAMFRAIPAYQKSPGVKELANV